MDGPMEIARSNWLIEREGLPDRTVTEVCPRRR